MPQEREHDIFSRLEALSPKLSRQRRKICRYILDNPLSAGNMSLAELAQSCGAGGATIMRLVTEDLGFDSFVSFKRELRNTYIHHQNGGYAHYQRQQMGLLQEREKHLERPSAAMLNSIPEYIQSLQTPQFWAQLECAVQLLVGAKRIFILGLRTAAVPALCLENELNQITGNVVQLSTAQELIFDRAMSMGPGDVLFVFSNWPCTKRTIDVADFAHLRGIPLILETNIDEHPLLKKAAAVINSSSVNLPYHALPTILMIEILSCEIRRRVKPCADQQQSELERLLNTLKIDMYGYLVPPSDS